MIIKTTNISTSQKRAEYFDFKGNLLFEIKLDTENKTFETFRPEDDLINKRVQPEACPEVLGQQTMDCLTDAYSNHGWVFAWAFVQTAFLPQTAVALAAACGYASLRDSSCDYGYVPIPADEL